MSNKRSTGAMKVATTKEIAEILGLTDRRIRQLAEEGALEKLERGKFDIPSSIQRYIEYQVTRQVGNVDDDLNKLKEETLWTRSRRKKSELEYKIMTGELHRSEDVETVMNTMLASFRSQLLAFPTKAAAKVTGLDEITQVQETLKKEIYELMQELSDYDPDEFYKHSRDKIFIDDDAVVKGNAED